MRLRDRIRRLPLVLRENLPLIVTTLLWALSWQIAWRTFDLPTVSNRGTGYFLERLGRFLALELGPVLLLLVPLLHLVRGGRASDFAARSFWEDLAGRYLTRRTLGGLVVVVACMPLFFAAYRDFKAAIPAIVPFWMDPVLEGADRTLHLGRHPWEWLQPILGSPEWTHLIDGLYVFWFDALLSVVLWMGFTRHRWVRARFFVTLILLYVLLGNVAALAFSSAGPAYYPLVTDVGADPFLPLMEYLRALDDEGALFAVLTQNTLWATYTGQLDSGVAGISAFPSVHVAVTTLLALTGLALNRVAAVAGVLFLVVILIGSVHLGWHYALDGYVSMAAVGVFWWISKPLTAAFLRWASIDVSDDPRAPPELRERALE